MIVIGIGGAARSGKDTVARYLTERHGFTRIGLADPLKALASAIDPIIDGHYGERHMNELLTSFGEDYIKEEYPEYRRFLIAMGMAMRDFDEDFWVDALLGFIVAKNGHEGVERFVVPDIRFENEVDGLRRLTDYDRGAVVEVWRVSNNEAEAKARETGQPTERLFDAGHVFDRTLNNNGDFDFLHMQVQGAIHHLVKELV